MIIHPFVVIIVVIRMISSDYAYGHYYECTYDLNEDPNPRDLPSTEILERYV